jgi:hypothetical protein
MSRPITLRMAEALKAGAPRVVFAAVDHPSGMGRFWTGIGSKSWDGQTWTGSGRMGGVAPIRATSELAIQEVVFWMAGVDPEVAARLNGEVRNLTGDVWLACLDDRDEVIADPYPLLNAVLDYQTFDASDDLSVVVKVIARSGFVSLERAIDEAWTPENQHLRFAGDTGLDLIPSLQNKEILFTWGP